MEREDLVIALIAFLRTEPDRRAVDGIHAVKAKTAIALEFRLDGRRVHGERVTHRLGHEVRETVALQALPASRIGLPATMGEKLFQQNDRLLFVAFRLPVVILEPNIETRVVALAHLAKPGTLADTRHDDGIQDRRLLDHAAHAVEREVARSLEIVAVDVDLHVVDPNRLHAALVAFRSLGRERDDVVFLQRLI